MDEQRRDAHLTPPVTSEDLAAYAVDAVDADERAAIDQRLRQDPALREELAALREGAAGLSEGVEAQPPAALRSTILSHLAETPQESADEQTAGETPTHATAHGSDEHVASAHDRTSVPDRLGSRTPGTRPPGRGGPHTRRRRPRAVLGMLGAMVVLVGLGVTAALTLPQPEERAPSALEQVVGAADARQVADAPPASDGGGSGHVVVVASAQRDAAVLQAQDLPAPPAGHAYQIWWLHGKGTPVSAGTFTPDARGQSRVLLSGTMGSADGVAVTVEPAGGSAQPTTEPVHVFTL